MGSRKGIWVGVGLLVCVLVLLIGLKLYFNSDRLRALLIPQMSEALNRSVMLQDVGLGFWGGVHVSATGLQVAERPGFGNQPFLQVDEADIFVAFWPLLSGDVVIKKIRLVSPQVSVVVLANGDANYADLTQSSDEGSGGKSAFFVHDVVIADGTVLYADVGKKTTMQFAGIDYALGMTQAETDWHFNGDLSIGRVAWQQAGQRDTLDTGILRLAHRVHLKDEAWEITALNVNWAGLAVTMSGQIKTVEKGLNLDLKIEEPGLDLGTTKLRELAKLPLDITGKASMNLHVVGLLNVDNTPPQYPNMAGRVSLSGVTLVGDDTMQEIHIETAVLTLTDGVLLLNELSGKALGGAFSMSGRVSPVWPPEDKRLRVELDAQTDVLKLTEGAQKQEQDASSIGDPLVWLRRLDARLSVKIGQVLVPNLDVRAVETRMTLTDGQLNIGTLQGQLYGGQVRVSGVLDASAHHQSFPIALGVVANDLDVKPLLGTMPNTEVDGRLFVDVRAKGLLDGSLRPVLQSGKYTLLGNASLQKGMLKTPELLAPVDSLAWSVEFVQDNVFRIGKLVARAGDSDVSISGRVDGLLAYVLDTESKVRPYVVARIQSKMLNLDALFPVTMPTDGDQTSGMLTGIRMADGRVDVGIGTLVSDSTRYTDFQATAVAQNGMLQVDSIRANTLGGVMLAQAEIDGREKGLVPVRATASLARIQAERFLQGYMRWPIPMFGQLGVAVKLEGQMDSTLTLIEKTIRADGEARLDEGRVVNWPWLQTASGFVPNLQFLNFSDMPLKSLVAPFKMDQGRVFLNQMGFQSGDVGFQLVGSAGVDGSLDMVVDADIPVSRLNVGRLGLDRLAGANLRPDARMPLRIQIGGTADKPQIDAKLQPEAQKALDAKSEELKNKVKDKTKGLLKSLF